MIRALENYLFYFSENNVVLKIKIKRRLNPESPTENPPLLQTFKFFDIPNIYKLF